MLEFTQHLIQGTNLSSRFFLLILVFFSQSFNFAMTLQAMLLTESGALSPVQAGLILAFGSLVAGCLQPFLGGLLDQGRVKRTFVLIAVAYAIGVYGYWNPNSSAGLLALASLVLVMAGLTLRTIISMALIASCQGEERVEAASLRYLVSNAALAVSSGIALFTFKNYRHELLLIDLATSLILAFGMLRHIRKRQCQNQGAKISMKESKDHLLAAMKRYGRLIIGLSLITVGFTANLTYIPLLFAKRGGADTDVQAMILLSNAIVVILFMNPVRKWTKSWPGSRIGKIGTLMIASGLIVAPLTNHVPTVLLGVVIWTLGEVIFIPWEQLQLFQCFDDTSPGVASGAVSFLFSVCQIISPVFASLLLAVPEWISILLMLAVTLGGYCIFRKQKYEKREDAELDYSAVA